MKTRVVFAFYLVALLLPTQADAYFTTYNRLTHNILKTINWTPPTSTLLFGFRPIVETVTNGEFSDGANGWTIQGDVVIADGVASIGTRDGTLLLDNQLSQTIPNTAKSISFEYQVHTMENLRGFDDPCFTVTLNDAPVLQVNSSSVEGSDETRSTEWKKFSVELSRFSDPALTVKFSAGNNGDTEKQSWVEVRNITTNVLVGNSTETFSVQTTDDTSNQVDTFLKNCDGITAQVQQPFTLTDHQPCELSFWGKDSDANTEDPHLISTDIQTLPLSFTPSLVVTHEPTDEFVLNLPPLQKEFAQYEIFASSDPISAATDMDTLTPLDQSTESIHAPLQQDQLFVEPTELNHFLVKGTDLHNNTEFFMESL